MVDVALRMIVADNKIDESELQLLQLIKVRLKTSEETLLSKFPKQIEFLLASNNYGAQTSFENEILLD